MVPFSLSNYFYVVTKVRPIGYVLASWIGMLPDTVMYIYIGGIRAGRTYRRGFHELSEPLR